MAQFANLVVNQAAVLETLPVVPTPAGVAVEDAAFEEVTDGEIDERTEDGGAPPYLHTPLRAFAADDLSFPIENIDDIEFLED